MVQRLLRTELDVHVVDPLTRLGSSIPNPSPLLVLLLATTLACGDD